MNRIFWGMGHGIFGMGFPGLGLLFQLIIVGAVVFIIYWIITQTKEKESPLEIIKKRYAVGEISKKEFEELKEELA